MTNGDILREFKDKYPGICVDDYRPLSDTFIPQSRPGIMIWTKEGDMIIYFPKEGIPT